MPPRAKKQSASNNSFTHSETDNKTITNQNDKIVFFNPKNFSRLELEEHILKRPTVFLGSMSTEPIERFVLNEAGMKYFDLHCSKEERKAMNEDSIRFEYPTEQDYKTNLVNYEFIPGLLKLLDEAITNAADHFQNKAGVTYIKVTIDWKTGWITIRNNGTAIPCEEHEIEKIYVPELIFFHPLSGSNFDDTKDREVAGQNGLGVKLDSLFSDQMNIEIKDHLHSIHYKQSSSVNGSVIHPHKIAQLTLKEKKNDKDSTDDTVEMTQDRAKEIAENDFVEVAFLPSYVKRFKLPDGLNKAHLKLFYSRVFDIAGTICKLQKKPVNVFLNGINISTKFVSSFSDYISFHQLPFQPQTVIPDTATEEEKKVLGAFHKVELQEFKRNNRIVIEEPHSRLIIGACNSRDEKFHVSSFVNNVHTSKNGTHVQFVVDNLIQSVVAYVTPKLYNKKEVASLTKADKQAITKTIKSRLHIFLNCTIINPEFDTQAKQCLKTKPHLFGWPVEVKPGVCEQKDGCDAESRFGVKKPQFCEKHKSGDMKDLVFETITEKLVKKIVTDLNLLEKVKSWKEGHDTKQLKKNGASGKKSNRLTGITKLIDANWAGTARSEECSLIICEGESAKAPIEDALDILGRDKYGVISVKGKVKNLMKAISAKNLTSNKEIKDLVQAIGLQYGVKYQNRKSLRYGRIILMTDSDSVAGYTPLLLKNGDMIEIKTIETLTNEYMIDEKTGKEYGTTDYEVWTENGWSKINAVMRHKTTKEMFRVTTHTGVVDVTEDHSLLKSNGTILTPTEAKIGEQLLHSFPVFANLNCKNQNEKQLNLPSISENEAYVMGLFWANGTFVNGGKLTIDMVNKYRAIFYNQHKTKFIPSMILNANKTIRENFFEGYCDGYGRKNTFDIDSQIGSQGLFYLCKSLGYEVSLNSNVKKPKLYTLTITNGHQQANPNVLKKITSLGVTDGYVYDLETANHHFQAGAGQIIVHNTDGLHIQLLTIGLFQQFWPELLRQPGFMSRLVTPNLIVSNGNETAMFNSIDEHIRYCRLHPDFGRNWKVDYIKGLGTFTTAMMKRFFVNIKGHQQFFRHTGTSCDLALMKALGKDVNQRKKWLEDHANSQTLQESTEEEVKTNVAEVLNFDPFNRYDPKAENVITYTEFVDTQAILHALANNVRQIAKLIDGLKPSQQQVLCGAFLKNLTSIMKVSQFASFVADKTKYHHGEVSLQNTIIGMAQNFVGKNNINLLFPSGQFGTRSQGGKNAADARYIFTKLSKITRKIFPAEDDAILKYLIEEGYVVQPCYYLPILPMCLVNGSRGIGTGCSSMIPQFNPRELVTNIRLMLNKQEPQMLHPFYKNFKGIIEPYPDDPKKYRVSGLIEDHDTMIKITELPIGWWTASFKVILEEMLEKELIHNFEELHTENAVKFQIMLTKEQREKLLQENNNNWYCVFGLMDDLSTNNMVLFDSNGKLHKYNNVSEIEQKFFHHRYLAYKARLDYLVQFVQEEIELLKNKQRFLLDVRNKVIEPFEKEESENIAVLEKLGYKKKFKSKLLVPGKKVKNSHIKTEEGEYEDDQNDQNENDDENGSYNYLLNCTFASTQKKQLERLINEIKEKEQQFQILKTRTVEEIWNADLDAFLKALDEHELAEEDARNEWKLIIKDDSSSRAAASKKKPQKRKSKDPINAVSADTKVKKRKKEEDKTKENDETAVQETNTIPVANLIASLPAFGTKFRLKSIAKSNTEAEGEEGSEDEDNNSDD